MNSFMMNVGLMNMGPSIYGNLKDYGSHKALTAGLRPTGTMNGSSKNVGNTNNVTSQIPKAKQTIPSKKWREYFGNKYGNENVNWELPPRGIDDIIENPRLITRYTPSQLAEVTSKAGWQVGPLKKGNLAGKPYTDGGGISMNAPQGSGSSRYIQYHPGKGHHGADAYYKISSPKGGTFRVYIDGRVVKE
nr:hypothetical protein [Enterococcus sp. 7F3_DIV0205]OTN84696.1 hypothetical protein A5821_000625 [Enterococcus sp. 7F3_DIV0205]